MQMLSVSPSLWEGNDAGRFVKVAGSVDGKRLTYKELTNR